MAPNNDLKGPESNQCNDCKNDETDTPIMKPSKEEGERAWLFTQCERYDLAPSQMTELLALFESHDENSTSTAVLSSLGRFGNYYIVRFKRF